MSKNIQLFQNLTGIFGISIKSRPRGKFGVFPLYNMTNFKSYSLIGLDMRGNFRRQSQKTKTLAPYFPKHQIYQR